MKSESGSVYVEFSVVLPYFLLICMGMYSIGLLLGNLAILVPTSYEALHAGAGRLQGDGEVVMSSITDQFVNKLGRGLDHVQFTPSYYSENVGGEDVPVVEVDLVGSVDERAQFASLGLHFSLVGPHIGRDLNLENLSYDTIGQYDCSGNPCMGDEECPRRPCGSIFQADPADTTDQIGNPIERSQFDDSELPNHDFDDLNW
ncbi:MAG: pilus assembly protein [Bdellovibrionales bacterium]|nr:pilus assembly protein [Bdellovibrionales bacterium]